MQLVSQKCVYHVWQNIYKTIVYNIQLKKWGQPFLSIIILCVKSSEYGIMFIVKVFKQHGCDLCDSDT